MTRDWIATSLAMAEAGATALGLTGDARAAYIGEHRFDHALALAVQEMRDGELAAMPRQTNAQRARRVPHHVQVPKRHRAPEDVGRGPAPGG